MKILLEPVKTEREIRRTNVVNWKELDGENIIKFN